MFLIPCFGTREISSLKSDHENAPDYGDQPDDQERLGDQHMRANRATESVLQTKGFLGCLWRAGGRLMDIGKPRLSGA
jgi:hypothetical protein